MANGTVSSIVIGGVAGGFTSAFTGGYFWDARKTGLIVVGLNHGVHLAQSSIAFSRLFKNYPKYENITDEQV